MRQTLSARVEDLKTGLQRQLGVEPLAARLEALRREAAELRARRALRAQVERRRVFEEAERRDLEAVFEAVELDFGWIFGRFSIDFQ